jgi:hypothetical protein
MKHKTLFRLLVKAIGILLLAFAIPELVGVMAYYLIIASPGSAAWSTSNWIYSMLGPAIQAAIGAYLFLEGKWVIDKCIPSNRPYCPECGYDLSHNVSTLNCPECGVTLPRREPENP